MEELASTKQDQKQVYGEILGVLTVFWECKSRLTLQKVLVREQKERLEAAVMLRLEHGEISNKNISFVLGLEEYEVSRALKKKSIVPRQKTLTQEEEEKIIAKIKISIQQNRPMTKTDVKILALNLWKERTGTKREKMLSDSWWRGFRSRYVDLKLRYVRSQDYKRALAEQKGGSDAWIKETRDFIVKHGIKQENIFNIDEKGVLFTDTKQKVVMFVYKNARETLKPKVFKQTQSQHFTLVGGITGLGGSLKPYYVLQFPIKKNWSITSKNEYGYLEVNKSGYVDESIKLDCVQFFVKQLTTPGDKLLLVDNHGSNFSPELLQWANENKVHIKSFPSNMTHILQPLDLVIFSSFSQSLKNMILKQLQDKPNFKIAPEHYQQFSYFAWVEATKPTNVMAAWNKSGIINCSPLSPQDQGLIPKPPKATKKSSKALALVQTTSNALVTTDSLPHKQRSMMMRDKMSTGTVWTDDTNRDLVIHYKKETRKRRQPKKSDSGDVNLSQVNNYNTFNQINVATGEMRDENNRPAKRIAYESNTNSSSQLSTTIQNPSFVSSVKSLFNKFLH